MHLAYIYKSVSKLQFSVLCRVYLVHLVRQVLLEPQELQYVDSTLLRLSQNSINALECQSYISRVLAGILAL